MGNILMSIIAEVIRFYTLIVVANAILSWFIHSQKNIAVRRIYWITNQLVDPVLSPIRQVLSPMTRNFGIDISPFILIMFLQILKGMLS